MKSCPTCRKTYTDDGLNFCLEDGSVLTLVGNDAPDTVMMNQPRFTEPNTAMRGVTPPQSTFGDQSGYTMQPKKSGSKAWIWVLLIVGFLMLACGGGFVGLVIYLASLDPGGNNSSAPTPAPDRGTPTPTRPAPSDVKKIDLSNWVQESSNFGNTDFSDGEFYMSSKRKGYYYVVAAPPEFKTERASTTVTLRNVNDSNSTLGYGLVFHSDPKPLQKGYAFLLDTKGRRYRIVRHEPQKEINIINWTTSNAIKTGSAENVLEVRDTPERIELYINGEMVTTIKNTHGYSGGVVGLYSGDAVNIAFKGLEIAK